MLRKGQLVVSQYKANDLRNCAFINFFILAGEVAENDPFQHASLIGFQELPYLIQDSMCRVVAWIAIDTSADTRECNALHFVLDGQFQTATVAAAEQVFRAVLGVIDGTNGVDDTLTREIVSISDLGITSVATTQFPTFLHEVWTSGAVDGTIDAATAKKGFIGSIDDTVNLKLCNVTANQGDDIIESLGWLIDGIGNGSQTV